MTTRAIDPQGTTEPNEIACRSDVLGGHSPAIIQRERFVNRRKGGGAGRRRLSGPSKDQSVDDE